MKGIRAFLTAAFFLMALSGVAVVSPDQGAWALDLNVDVTPDKDSGLDVDVAPDNRDRDIEQDRRFHGLQQDQHERFHEKQEHERFHRNLQERDREFHDSNR
jgi:hypothetical protein